MNRRTSTRNRIRSIIHFGGNNGGSADKFLVIRVVCLIMAGRKLVVIIFRTMDFVSIGKF